jgi:Flp pilus assembly protein TadD
VIAIIIAIAAVPWLMHRGDLPGAALKARTSDDSNRVEPITPEGSREHTYLLAGDLIARHRITEARGHLERALTDHEDAGLLELLGVCYEAEGAIDKAEETWRRALAMDTNNPAVLLDLGRLAISARRLEEAVSLLERAAELSPGSIDPVYNLSRAYRLKGDIAKAKHFEDLADQLRLTEPPRGGMGVLPEEMVEPPPAR